MNYLDVHSFGKVLQNKILQKDTSCQSEMDTTAKYKFTIAFENAVARDYVTEEFYDLLIAGSVPIYLGAPNIDDFAPGDKCFINAADWDSPDQPEMKNPTQKYQHPRGINEIRLCRLVF